MPVTILDAAVGYTALPATTPVSSGSNRKLFLAAFDGDGVDAGGAFNPTIGGVARTNAVAASAPGQDVDIRLYEWDEAAIASMPDYSVAGEAAYGEYFIFWTVQDADQSAGSFSPVTSAVTAASGAISAARVADSLTIAVGATDQPDAFTASSNPAFSLSANDVEAKYRFAYGDKADTSNTSDFTWSTVASRDASFVVLNIAPAAASASTITNINTTNEFTPGETNTLNGENLSETGGSIVIDGEAQTITNRTATAITFTGVRGGNPYNNDLTLTYTDADSNTATQTVQQVPADGEQAVTAVNPSTDDASLATQLIDTATGDPVTVVDGDQVWATDYGALSTPEIPFTINPDFTITAGNTGTFTVQFWRASEGVWGSDQTVTFEVPDNGGGTPVDPVTPDGQSIRNTVRNSARNTVRSTRRTL